MAAAQGYPLLCLENPLLGWCAFFIIYFACYRLLTAVVLLDIQARGYELTMRPNQI